MSKKLSDIQIEFGNARVGVLSELIDINEDDLIKVLKCIDKVNYFYDWVNADLYLSNK